MSMPAVKKEIRMCPECSKEIPGWRNSGAKYCSKYCATKASRDRAKERDALKHEPAAGFYRPEGKRLINNGFDCPYETGAIPPCPFGGEM